MAWISTVDERSGDGFIRSPDYYDAPNTLNTTYRLASNSTAYGNLTDAYLLPDEDVYSLGVLSTGNYTLDVDEYIWDFSSSNNGDVTKFEILNSLGTVVATSYSTFSDINFTVYDSSTYYARIVGSSFDEQQYTARYYKTGELNTPTIWASTPSLSGNLRAGSTLDVDIDYFDEDGNSDEIYFTGWYLDGDYVGASETLTLTDADYGKVVSVEFGLSDDAGNVEVSGLYILGIVNTPTDWADTASFTGELLAGSTLDASILYADVDGNSDGIYATNWYLDDEYIGTQETITLTPSDYGKTVVVGFALVDDANNFELSGGYLLGRVNTPPTGSVAISGTATQGATLTADTSGLDDPDGLGTFSYQWLRDGNPITGANAENYVFTQNDVATAINVTVSYTDGGGKVESVTSDPADDVPGKTDTEATLGVGQTFNGALESAGDQDWFAVNFVAGQTYLIRMTPGTLLDPLIMVAEATGEIIKSVDNGYDGQSEIFVWTAEYTGPGFIVADSYYNNISSSISDYGSDTGSYSLTYETYEGAIGVTIDETPIDAASIWVDSLKNGTAWASASGASVTTITYTFAAGPGGEVTGSEWDAASQAAFEHAILQYEAIANIDFVYVADVQDANIAWWLGSDADFDEASLGWHYPPVPGSIASSGAFNIDALGWTAEGLAPGGYGYVTVIHELGHALGLAHPHDAPVPFPGVTSPLDDYGDFQLNQGIWTTMSYNSGWPSKIPPTDTTAGYEGSPMALDVAAIQEIYGINENYETGDNVYLLSDVLNQAWICVWDAGGIDMLSGEGLSDDLLIDLRYATLDDANAGGFVSCAISYDSFLPKKVGGYTIANGVTIENAKGGDGDDLIVGNDSANVLYGLGGNDTFLGGRGHDTIYGGEGADTVSYAGNFSSYSIVEHSDYVVVSGSDFVDQLEGIEYLTFDDFQYRVEGAGNSAPVAAVYTKSVAEDSYVSGTVVATDVDNYPEELVYSLQPGDGPLHGSIIMDASGAYTYTPNADFNGEDSFTYTVTDSNGASDTAVVTIIVSAVDDAPVAQDTSREATEANDASGVIVGQLAATDLDNDHADITYALDAEAPAGLTLNTDGSYTFDPSVATYNSLSEGDQKVVSVGYTATSNGLTDTGVITVTVTGTNDAPVAAMSSKGVTEDGSVSGVVVATDVDSDSAGFVYSVEAGDGPASGVLNIDSNGAYTYTPNADFNGEDSFTYTVTDSNGGTDTAVVTITVSAVDDAPAAQDATAAVAEDATLSGQLSATDVDNNDADITYALNQSVAGLTLNDDGSWEFDAGNDAYQALAAGETNVVQTTYTATSNGKTDSGVITITVTGTNDAPVATASILSGPENTDITSTVSASDVDGSADDLVYAVTADPANGTVVMDADGSFTYTPNTEFNGEDSFVYTAIDLNGAMGAATVAIIISAVNTAPTGSAVISGTATQGATLTADTSGLDDPDGLGTFSYQWLRDGNPITGANAETYALTQGDVDTAINVTVSYTDGGSTAESVTSDPTDAVVNVNDSPMGSVVISGTATQGATLTADTSGLDDPDGLGTFSYQWLRDGSPISDANAQTYALTQDDVATAINVTVSYTDGYGAEESVTSDASDAVASRDRTLVGDDGDNVLTGWDGEDSLAGGPGNDTLEGGAGADRFIFNPGDGEDTILDFELGVDTLDLSGFNREDALSAFYSATLGSAILTFADGTSVRVAGDNVTPDTLSLSDIEFAEGNLPASGNVTIIGTAKEGETLTANTSGVSDGDGIDASTESFQWLRDGDPITGAVSETYVLNAEDIGSQLSVTYAFLDNFRTNEAVSSEPTDIVLGAGRTFNGTSDPDEILGTLGADTINGQGSDDVLRGNGGNDIIDGGVGFDTAVYSGSQNDYTVQLSADGVTVADRVAGRDGIDDLIDVDNLRFSDGDFNIDIRTGAADLPAEDFAAIVELYIAYFNRAPASKGLLYWADRLEDGMPLPKIAESFFVQPETQNTYAEYLDENGKLKDTEAFVKAVFNNVLGRDPYGPYWINELDNNPAITPAIFILAVLNGAKAPTGGAEDREFLANKTDIGIYFSAIKGLSDYDDTIAVMNLFDGTEESVDAAVAAMDAIYEEALDPNTGEFIMPLVGVVDDPFAIV